MREAVPYRTVNILLLALILTRRASTRKINPRSIRIRLIDPAGARNLKFQISNLKSPSP